MSLRSSCDGSVHRQFDLSSLEYKLRTYLQSWIWRTYLKVLKSKSATQVLRTDSNTGLQAQRDSGESSPSCCEREKLHVTVTAIVADVGE